MNEIHKKTINDKELETLTFWQDNQIFEKSIQLPAGSAPKGSFTFYDGPPFATGAPHHGHILAGTIKDTIPRYQTMRGNTVRRVWGWDCHGLPLENIVEKKYNLKDKKDIEEFGIDNFNEAARASVFEYEAEWKKVIPRMGRFVDMDHPYKTMDSSYTESIWWSFKTLFDKGLIYEGNKIMHICPRCETTLAQSEVNMPGSYRDVTDISVTVQFPLIGEENTYILAWTTTPWTLPGNTALAVNKDVVYAKVKINTEETDTFYIVAKSKITDVFEGKEVQIVEEFLGEKLVGLTYTPPFDYFSTLESANKDNIYKIWHADFITEDAGTGIAHEAPAFGAEDYELARALNIPLVQHVALDGTFTKEVTDFFGMKVKIAGDTQSADIEIIKCLAKNGTLFSKKKIIHSYPHCWRCDTPLLNYATSSWFMDVIAIKSTLLSENQKIGWVPEHTRDGRFGKWLEGARDWALSRSRYWGAPLPVWKCTECSRVEVLGSIDELQNKRAAQNQYSVMRHGECLFNTKDLADSTGSIENHLTEKGKAEVVASAEKMKSEKYDFIITSPIVRAQETAQIVSEILEGIEIIVDERLRELDFGIYDGKNFNDFWKLIEKSHQDFDLQIEGGESYHDIQKRVTELLFECEEKYAGKKILFVTHGGIMWMVISVAQRFTDTQIREYREIGKKGEEVKFFIPNASVEKLSFRPYPHSAHGLDLHRPYIDEAIYECTNTDCTGQMKRIPDVFDCWYESGSMPFASIHYPFENKELFNANFPADFIAEGLDQTRGWFYSLMNMSVGLFDRAPYKNVIVNGLTMAADGQKMSKSKNNFTDPMLLAEKYGADSLRFALINSPLVRGENTLFPDSLVDEASKKVVQKLENVYSFYEMYQSQDIAPSSSSQHVLDHWIRSRLYETIRSVTLGLDAYQLDSAARPFENFIDDLSTWYVRRSRNRMKSEDERDRVQSIETLGYVLVDLSKCIAPFMPFIAERIYQGVNRDAVGKKESVHLEAWPFGGHIDEIALQTMSDTRKLVTLGLEARSKVGIKVRQPLQSVSFKSIAGQSVAHLDTLADELNVKEILENSSLEIDAVLDTDITAELQNEGDLRELTRTIKDIRKEAGLTQGDSASLTVQTDVLGQEFLKSIQIELQKNCGLSSVTVATDNIEKTDKEESTNTKEVSIGELQFTITMHV